MSTTLSSICVFCKTILDINHENQLSDILDLLEIIFINLNVSVLKKFQICHICEENLRKAFKFKEMCIYTYDKLYPYFTGYMENEKKIDLNKVYAEENNCKLSNDVYVCRLCFELMKDSKISHLLKTFKEKNFEDIFQEYLPDINLDVENPIICEQCIESLENFVNFISCASKTICNIEDEYQMIMNNCNISNFEQNLPNIDETSRFIDAGSVKGDKKRSCPRENNAVQKDHMKKKKIICKYCSKEFESHEELTYHISSVKHIKCNICPYTAKIAKHLELHMRKHEQTGSADLKMKKCPECEYRSVNMSHVRTHVTRVHNLDEAFKCAQCDFRTMYKRTFKNHIKQHS